MQVGRNHKILIAAIAVLLIGSTAVGIYALSKRESTNPASESKKPVKTSTSEGASTSNNSDNEAIYNINNASSPSNSKQDSSGASNKDNSGKIGLGGFSGDGSGNGDPSSGSSQQQSSGQGSQSENSKNGQNQNNTPQGSGNNGGEQEIEEIPTGIPDNNIIKPIPNPEEDIIQEELGNHHKIFYIESVEENGDVRDKLMMMWSDDSSEAQEVTPESEEGIEFNAFEYSLPKMKGIFNNKTGTFSIDLNTFEIKKIDVDDKIISVNPNLNSGLVVRVTEDGQNIYFYINFDTGEEFEVKEFRNNELKPVRITDDGHLLFIKDSELLKLSLESKTKPESILMLVEDVSELDCSKDGQFFSIITENKDDSFILNASNKNIISLNEFDSKPTFSPTSNKFAYLSSKPSKKYELRVINLEIGKNVDINIPENLIIQGIHSWSPDGQFLYLITKYNDIVCVSLEDEEKVKLLKNNLSYALNEID